MKLHNHKIISKLQDEIYKLRSKIIKIETIASKGAELLLTTMERLFDYSEENDNLKQKLKDYLLREPTYTLYTGGLSKKMPNLYYKNE